MANIDNVSFASLERTGAITPYQANPIRRAFEKLAEAGPTSSAREAARMGIAFGGALRAGGEGAVIGALLGGVQGALPGGLDVKVPFMATKHTAPADAVLAGVSMVLAAATAGHESGISGTFVSAAAGCSSVYTFRTVNDAIVKMRQAKSGVTAGGGAAPIPGTISKAQFAGEGAFGFGAERSGWGSGFLTKKADISQDPIVQYAASGKL